ncbi:hypothetical protein KSU1_C0732 [Candidatus Jettenia caeni]|uniref:Uncharacterized protein n=1 Tax=Candidatus Jettenia caeni TaxID=247490 RepID=I3IKT3_9BACT|nr:hypothetical protein [Candidatus Jettenia sp. AMX1]MDL1939491.1 hypothetical protein [Candidatus Jettenia sp. AMX1]GAB62328.1 hypothetical protein KSU1_C0732 [Candidatus Jettenia caeni]GJQ47191.1 MAG: hypothetical protein JETCAE04_29450 [Candidatus Jettenia caeni]
MNTTNKQMDVVSGLLHIVLNIFLLVFISVFISKNALSQEKNSATQYLGVRSGNINITLSTKTALMLEVPSNALKEDANITLSESEVMPYNEDIIGLFSLKVENAGTSKIKRPLNIKVFPGKGIDENREEMLQVYKLRKQHGNKKYWMRVQSFHINEKDGSIDILINEPGTYKIKYSKLKVGGLDKKGVFFKLNAPNGSGKPANFSLRFIGNGYRIHLGVEDEDENLVWSSYNEPRVINLEWLCCTNPIKKQFFPVVCNL